jgi:hypothetical protein
MLEALDGTEILRFVFAIEFLIKINTRKIVKADPALM